LLPITDLFSVLAGSPDDQYNLLTIKTWEG